MPVGNPFISLVKSRFMSGLVFFKALWSNISTQKNGRLVFVEGILAKSSCLAPTL